MGFFVTLSTNDIECRYDECLDYLNVMLNVVLMNVVLMNVVLMNVVAPRATTRVGSSLNFRY
jgi:hypothetical protein